MSRRELYRVGYGLTTIHRGHLYRWHGDTSDFTSVCGVLQQQPEDWLRKPKTNDSWCKRCFPNQPTKVLTEEESDAQ